MTSYRCSSLVSRTGLILVGLCFFLLAAGCGQHHLNDRTVGFQSTPCATTPSEIGPRAAPRPAAPLPERIVLNLTTTPAVSQAVTWRTEGAVTKPRARIVEASGLADFNDQARNLDAHSEAVSLQNDRTVFHHAVVFKDLNPDTLYAYQVGAAEGWSEWSHFRTACAKAAPLTFVYFGDPQNELKAKCSRVFRAAFAQAPEADFWHFIGDLVNNGERDEEWDDFFYALGSVPRQLPLILLPGNHEYPDKRLVSGPDFHLTRLWRPHFTLPENGPAGLEETVYYIDYQQVRLVMLNGNERLQEQADWLNRILSVNPRTWTIAAIHQPVYATGKHRDDQKLQALLVPIFDKYEVDLVLQGHDHNYSRSAKLRKGKKVGNDESGTVYVISVVGPKSYPVNPRYAEL
ncbi:MAG: metallophosphoesterase family protein, partial [Pontiellaceae bacterium]|nr:metallophosphoesterase family protein [Pontiellaceae bacterium]